MGISNIYEFEELLVEELDNLVQPGMIFTAENAQDLDNESFTQHTVDEDKIGILVVNGGFKADPIVAKNNQQKIKMFWRISVVCPRELYRVHGGYKLIEIANKLKGNRLSNNYTKLMMVSDERDFNAPEFENDLAFLPSMYQVEAII